jgi:hypothetical protein
MKAIDRDYYTSLLGGLSYHDLMQETRRLKRANRRLAKTVRALAQGGDADDADFTLRNPQSSKKPWRGPEPQTVRQTLLIAGMGCLAGQQDLFETEGEVPAVGRPVSGVAELQEGSQIRGRT